ncbi:hypothetical protein L873DRAFT_691614 [Choiromyces venosus 120613-1]|uniref:Uncharacterized protein n=1 Tax=Choiromyces venosus 120613-1 TaxID=1336337 RepID=A0A3N4JVG4_9PEZI|nr:hypothetical protein L873DRAFT_691614 [Choiromyces venosus 120613-1]
MMLPLFLLLCFPALSLSMALPSETNPASTKALFTRGNDGCEGDVPEFLEHEVATRLGYLNGLVLEARVDGATGEASGLKKRTWLLNALKAAPIYKGMNFPKGLIASYHFDTMRGRLKVERPSYPNGPDLLKSRQRQSKPGQVVFKIDYSKPGKRPLQLIKISDIKDKAEFKGQEELSSEHLVEVAPTLEFVKNVLGITADNKLGKTLDIQWLIIENIKYKIDGLGRFNPPLEHLREAVGSTLYPHELVIMTKGLNVAKAPLIQGRDPITQKAWEKFGDDSGAKFEAVARIATVAEAVLTPEARAATQAQMKRLTKTAASFDEIYNQWYCSYEKDNTIWAAVKTRIETALAKSVKQRPSLKAQDEKDYKTKLAADPDYPKEPKPWPEIIPTLPAKPPAPSTDETFEKQWIAYQKKIYKKFRAAVPAQLAKYKEMMKKEYNPTSGTNICKEDGPAVNGPKTANYEALMAVKLPDGWEDEKKAIIIHDDDFKFTPAAITMDPSQK